MKPEAPARGREPEAPARAGQDGRRLPRTALAHQMKNWRGRRPRQGGRARGAVLWGMGLFALGQLALLLGSDTVVPLLRDPIFYTRLAHLRQQQTADPPSRTVLLLG